MLEYVKKELVFGGHLLSLGAASIVASTQLITSSTVMPVIILTGYIISQIVYNFDHIKDLRIKGITNLERTSHFSKHLKISISLFTAYLATLLLLFFILNTRTLFLAILITASGIFYTLKLKAFTKKLLAFKNLYVSFFWGLLVFLPLLEIKNSNFSIFASLFIFVFLRLMVNTIFFDIKDVKEDAAKKLKTIPAVFGLEKTQNIIHSINLISAVYFILIFNIFNLPLFTLGLLIFPIYSLYYIINLKKLKGKKLRILSYLLVDGEYLFWPFVLILAKIVFN